MGTITQARPMISSDQLGQREKGKGGRDRERWDANGGWTGWV